MSPGKTSGNLICKIGQSQLGMSKSKSLESVITKGKGEMTNPSWNIEAQKKFHVKPL